MAEDVSTGESLPDDVSALLRAWTDGDQRALARLTPIVYDELHRLALPPEARAGRPQPADDGAGQRSLRAAGRLQTHAVAEPGSFHGGGGAGHAPHPRRHARRRNTKRGANAEHVSLDAEAVLCTDRSDDFGVLDDALNALAARAARKAKVVELRFFGGLSVEETADVLRVSPITVMREWKSAKAWLYRELAGPTANGR